MKIMYLVPHLSTGGMPQYTYLIMKKLVESGHEIHCVEYQDIAPIYKVQKDRIKNLLADNYACLGEDKFELFNILERVKPDILHIQEIPELNFPDDFTSRIYENRPYKIIETTHAQGFDVKNNKRWIPDGFVFVNESHISQYEHLNVPYEVVFPELEEKERPDRTSVLQSLGLDPNKKHVLNVGLFTRRKNQGEAFDVAKSLPDVQFHFIGNQAGNFADYWQPIMKDKPDNCIIWGERNDVDLFYSCMDLFLFTSKPSVGGGDQETCPMVIKEALSWGMPVYCYKMDTYGDMYDNNELVTYIDNVHKDVSNFFNNADRKCYVVSAYTDEMEEQFKVSNSDFSKYCGMHNYNLRFYKDPMDDEDSRAKVWGKVAALQKTINDCNDGDLLLWLDADTIITNKNIKIEDMIEDGVDITFGLSVINRDFQLAVMVIRKTDVTVELIEEWLACDYGKYLNKAIELGYKDGHMQYGAMFNPPWNHEVHMLRVLIGVGCGSEEEVKGFDGEADRMLFNGFEEYRSIFGELRSDCVVAPAGHPVNDEENHDNSKFVFHVPAGKLIPPPGVNNGIVGDVVLRTDSERALLLSQKVKELEVGVEHYVVSAYTDEMEEQYNIANLNFSEYCEKHGYHYRCYKDPMGDNELDRHNVWSKVAALKKVFEECKNGDLVLWLDLDIVITNKDIKFEDMIADNVDVACGKNSENDHKLSVIVFRKTKFTTELLEEWWNNDFDKYKKRAIELGYTDGHVIYDQSFNPPFEHEVQIWRVLFGLSNTGFSMSSAERQIFGLSDNDGSRVMFRGFDEYKKIFGLIEDTKYLAYDEDVHDHNSFLVHVPGGKKINDGSIELRTDVERSLIMKDYNLPEKVFFTYCDETYLNLAENLIRSLDLNSEYPIVLYTINCDANFDYPNLYKIRYDDPLVDESVSGEEIMAGVYGSYWMLGIKPKLFLDVLSRGVQTVIYLDSDIVVRDNIDSVWENELDEFPLGTAHSFQFCLYNDILEPGWEMMNFLGMSDRYPKPSAEKLGESEWSTWWYRQGCFTMFDRKSIWFIEEWWDLCNNEEMLKDGFKYYPYREETPYNVLFAKYSYHRKLPQMFVNIVDYNHYLRFKGGDVVNSAGFFTIDFKPSVKTLESDTEWQHFDSNRDNIKFYHGLGLDLKDRISCGEKILKDLVYMSRFNYSELPEHLGGHNGVEQIDYGAMMWLKDKFDMKTFLDIGCAYGHQVELFRKHGIDSLGIDGDFTLPEYDHRIVHDYNESSCLEIENRSFDVGWAVEFLEHVEEKYMDNYMKDLQKCKYVICTAAFPDQGGYYHVNEQPLIYWIAKFKKYGFEYCPEQTAELKKYSTMGTPEGIPSNHGYSTFDAIDVTGMFFYNRNSEIGEFYSDYGEDKWIYENIFHLFNGSGFYVDVGAAHPIENSNTAFLRDRGWDGVSVDANPYWEDMWKERDVNFANVAISSTETKVKMLVPYSVANPDELLPQCTTKVDLDYQIGGKCGEVISDAITLDQLVEEYDIRDIDILDIDVEGFELDVWKSLTKIKPKVVIIEYNTQGVLDMDCRDDILANNEYDLVHSTEVNDIFIKNEYSKLFFESRSQYLKYYSPKQDDVVVDIGASNGEYSLEFIDSGASKCFCIEPSEVNYNLLLDKINNEKYKDKIFADNKAIYKLNEPINASIDPGSFWGRFSHEKSDTVFEGITFKTYVETNNIETIDLLKVDCEGGEYFIFTDENYDFIQNNVKNIAGEFHAHNAVEHDMHRAINICKELKELGFQVWVHLLADNNPAWPDFSENFLNINPEDNVDNFYEIMFYAKNMGMS